MGGPSANRSPVAAPHFVLSFAAPMERQPSPREYRSTWAAIVVLIAITAIAASCGRAPQSELTERTSGVVLGGAASNVALDTADDRVMIRWSVRRGGVVDLIHVRVKVEGSTDCPYRGRPGYASGTTGTLFATTHRIDDDGALSPPIARGSFNPCERQRGESVGIDIGAPAARGEILATVISNTDPNPDDNHFSLNFLTRNDGDRQSARGDVPFPGRDARESVQLSSDGGATWNASAELIPTYVVEYADGGTEGQPFYWSVPVTGRVVMTFRPVGENRIITGVGAYTNAPGAADVTVIVAGSSRARVRLSGTGLVRAPIEPVVVRAGEEVTLETVAGPDGLGLRELRADAVWEELVGLGQDYQLGLAGNARRAVALYPLTTPS